MNSRVKPRVCLGRVSRPHGLRGEVRAILEVDGPETLAGLQTIELDGVPYRLEAVRVQNNAYLLSLEGIATREEAQRLAGREITVDPAQLPALPPGEYYQFELIGLAAYLADTMAFLGEVTGILTTPAHDILVIEGGGREYLVPLVDQAIVSIAPAQGRLLVSSAGLTTANGAY